MDEGTGILPGLPPVAGKPVHLTFDGENGGGKVCHGSGGIVPLPAE
jgi:hypothetical protein